MCGLRNSRGAGWVLLFGLSLPLSGTAACSSPANEPEAEQFDDGDDERFVLHGAPRDECGDEIIGESEFCDDGAQNGSEGFCSSDCSEILGGVVTNGCKDAGSECLGEPLQPSGALQLRAQRLHSDVAGAACLALRVEPVDDDALRVVPVMERCSGFDTQKWDYQPSAGFLQSFSHPDYCLSVDSTNAVLASTCDGSQTQQWSRFAGFLIKHAGTGMCLRTDSLSALLLEACDQDATSSWWRMTEEI